MELAEILAKMAEPEKKRRVPPSRKGSRHTLHSRKKMREAHLGVKLSPEHAKNNARFEKQNGSWKGDKVSYSGIHYWVISKLGRPDKCDLCGNEGFKSGYIDWANKPHTYKRILSDWVRACRRCHRAYDRKYNGAK